MGVVHVCLVLSDCQASLSMGFPRRIQEWVAIPFCAIGVREMAMTWVSKRPWGRTLS